MRVSWEYIYIWNPRLKMSYDYFRIFIILIFDRGMISKEPLWKIKTVAIKMWEKRCYLKGSEEERVKGEVPLHVIKFSSGENPVWNWHRWRNRKINRIESPINRRLHADVKIVESIDSIRWGETIFTMDFACLGWRNNNNSREYFFDYAPSRPRLRP